MASPRTINSTITRDIDGVDVPIAVELKCYPGTPGRYSGRPEDCYPSEDGEVVVVSSVREDTGETIELTEDEIERIVIRASDDGFDYEGLDMDYMSDRDIERAENAYERNLFGDRD